MSGLRNAIERKSELTDPRSIGIITNKYGGLCVFRRDRKFYWSIEMEGDIEIEEEIPYLLFYALNRHEDERDKRNGVLDG